MKNKISQLFNDYRHSSWQLMVFALGLIIFMISASTLPAGEHWGPKLPDITFGVMRVGGGYLSDVVMVVLLLLLLSLWLTDSRRRYRSSRETLYFLLIIVALILGNVGDVLLNHTPLYERHNLANGGFESTISGLVLIPFFILAYLATLPLQRYLERREKPIKGMESKKIFK
jgi:Zn-dependent protease with chaperone function